MRGPEEDCSYDESYVGRHPCLTRPRLRSRQLHYLTKNFSSQRAFVQLFSSLLMAPLLTRWIQ